ncbi:MAG TPA: hypothetical protein VNP04_11690 [Alphaproteobacteria bacterium]|nr:hypothetical protein [Alphaproteobacteria bacterium]
MGFEWDPDREQSSLEKHGVDLTESAKVFIEPLVKRAGQGAEILEQAAPRRRGGWSGLDHPLLKNNVFKRILRPYMIFIVGRSDTGKSFVFQR